MDEYDVGDRVDLTTETRTQDGEADPELTDPTELTLTIVKPSEVEVEAQWPDGDIEKEETGKFLYPFEPDEVGVHVYRWVATGAVQSAEPSLFTVRDIYPVKWRPSPAGVAVELQARTRSKGGGLVGEFTESTNPTLAQVEHFIARAMQDIATKCGEVLPETYVEDARRLCELRTAVLIERSKTPEQNEDTRSLYQTMRIEYEERVKELAACIGFSIDAERGFL